MALQPAHISKGDILIIIPEHYNSSMLKAISSPHKILTSFLCATKKCLQATSSCH